MTLQALPDLFRRCRGRETGHWWVVKDHKRTLYLDSGDVVYASSTFHEDKLTSVMVECGKLTRDQMGRAMADLKPGLSIGKNLIEMGLITQADLLEAARLQVARIVRCALAERAAPGFEAKDDLDRSIVRLPLDTPSMLLAGVMGIQDREAVLELLGPLNQVVMLQSKRAGELGAPPGAPAGLLGAARLMDGTRTILEMGGQTGLDAAALGAFALFLREMGWAKLFELPPIDRKGLDEALTMPASMPPASIPAASGAPAPDASPREDLFRKIQDAAAPTASLDHLAEALDGLPPPPERPGEPAGPGSAPQTPQTPQAPPWSPDSALDHAGEPDDYSGEPAGPGGPPEQVGRVIVDPAQEGPAEPPERPMVIRDDPYDPDGADGRGGAPGEAKAAKPAKPPKAPKPPKARRRPPGKTVVLAVAAVMGAAAATAALWSLRTLGARRRPPFTLPLDDHQPRGVEAAKAKAQAPGDKADKAPAPQQQTPAQAQQQAPAQTQAAQQQVPAQTQAAQQQAPVQAKAPAQPPAQAKAKDAQADGARRAGPPPDVSPTARFAAISQGSTAVAIEQGRAYRDRLPKSAWTIRLVVAERGDTLKNCAGALGGGGGGGRDIFLTPLRMRDGRLCYQLFLGNFPTRLSAEAELRKLPDLLQRQQPRLMQVSDIAAAQ
jgi:hypothetical protein